MNKEIEKLLEESSGIQLDIGCGENKQKGFVGMDIRPLDGVDIVHDFEELPWPLPDESVLRSIASHVVEHINPHKFGFVNWMNEVWRVTKDEGQLAIIVPHGYSPGYLQDPTHCNACNEHTWYYFDPRQFLYDIYKPKPWLIQSLTWSPFANIEALLVKIPEDAGELIAEERRQKYNVN